MSGQILYDLIVHEEWIQEPLVLNQVQDSFWQHQGSLLTKLWKVTHGSLSYMIKSLKTQFRYQTSFGCPPHHFINLINNSLSWGLALSCDGRFVAILQDANIEIRMASDHFSKVIANCKIENDALPQWRKLVWNNTDNLMLAYSNSFGDIQIFDVTGMQKYFIPQINRPGLNVPGTLSQAVAFLHFTSTDNADTEKWSSTLYVATYQGYMKCYCLSESSLFIEKCSFSFASYHPHGVSCMVYDRKINLLLAAGNYGKEPFISEDSCYGSHCAISVWRLLKDYPYFTLVEDRGKGFKKLSGKELLKNFVSIRRKQEDESLKHGVYKMCLSPIGNYLATLHIDGRMSIWNMPSLKLERTWHKSEQPNESFNFNLVENKNDLAFFSNVIDINWWSDQELILATGNGAVTISSSENLTNLLGDSPERFDCWPTLSQAVDGHILVLECEKTISEPGDKSGKKAVEVNKWLSETDEDESVNSFRSRMKELTKQTLYFFTEAERFQPALKKPKILTNTYRLICLKSTTPEELYLRKIELEHYGDALDLAQRFNLNTDLVYQRQWRKRPVTKISIQDYLTKIKDRYWVLGECLLRIPEDFEGTEQLLKYGLLGTSWELLHAIDGDDEKEMKFIIDKNNQDDFMEEKEEKIFSGTLSAKQLRICKYRWQLLQYLDRLSTYEVILGGSFKARDKFSARYFSNFRSCNIVSQALSYARDGDSYALEHLFSYHGKQVLPHWLPIISNFPETANIKDYAPVIPEIGETPEDPEILPWLEKHHREVDWVEQTNIFEQIQHQFDDELGDFIYEAQPELLKFKHCDSKALLGDWFVERVHEIEERSKQIDNCYILLDVGIKRGLNGLKALQNNLKTLKVLIYDVNVDHNLSLKEYLTLSHLSKLKLLMSKSSEDSFVHDFQEYFQPYLQQRSGNSKQYLLHQFLVDIAKTDLTCCLKLFEKSTCEMDLPLIPDVTELMMLAMDCIYSCKRDDQLNLAFNIVECLPSREEDIISSQMEELHIQLDQLELLLGGAEILEFHSYPQTLAYILETKADANVAKGIIQLLIKNTVNKAKVASASDWNMLLKHLIKLVKDVYTCMDVKYCHQIFAQGLLQSGIKQNIYLCEERLTPCRVGSVHQKESSLKSALHVLKYDTSVKIVVEAAIEYFNSAASLKDPAMELARLCLSLITDKPASVLVELDMIDSLYLLEDFNVSMLPLQVRLCRDKFEIIDACLHKNSTNYKKSEKLFQISNLLQICGDDHVERHGKVKTKIAEMALEKEDYIYASTFCQQLVDDGFESSWDICRKLGECIQYNDYISRQKLLSFALTFCPVYQIEEILNAKRLLETQILYDQLSVYIATDIDADEETEVIDGGKESILKKTKNRTKQLLSSVKDTNWIGEAMKWVGTDSLKTETLETDSSVTCLQFNPFYCGIPNKISSLDMSRFFDLLMDDNNKTLRFNQLLLRSQKLSEQRAGGEITEETDECNICFLFIDINDRLTPRIPLLYVYSLILWIPNKISGLDVSNFS